MGVRAVLLLAAVAGLAAAVAVPPAAAWRERPPVAELQAAGRQRHESAARGWSLSTPPGWQLRRSSRSFADPSLCVELRSPGDHRRGPVRFHDSAVTPYDVEIRIVQLLTGRGPANERRRFRLATMAPPGGVEWTEGAIYSFRERSRSIDVGVLLGTQVSPARRRAVERIVNSLRIQPRPGRCPESPRP
jgi:hypothetical protein